MKNFLTSALLFSLLLVHGANSQCPDEVDEETLDELLTDAIERTASEGGGSVEVDIIAWNVNCLVAAPSGGYQMATVTISFNASGSALPRPFVNEPVQVILMCDTSVPLTPEWRQFISIDLIPSTSMTFAGGGQATPEELLNQMTNSSCLACNPIYAPTSPIFCLPCSENCAKGLMECYLDVNDKEVCCSYYDIFGNCVSECGMNQIPSEDFVCTCTNFYGPPGVCNECQITCRNGVPDSNCISCICDPGYAGRICDEDIDDCFPNPCQRGGTCMDGVNTFTCTCPPGYTGMNCEIDIDDCNPNPCKEGGVCTDGINSFTCTCPQGFTGVFCEADINECDFNNCENEGTCVDGINSYTCICPEGFTGLRCEIEIDECDPNPCEHDGTCMDGVNTFTCRCPVGYIGDRCEINIDDCFENYCLNGATCVDGINSFECYCAPGFTGERCEINIDDCASGPCLNGGTCMDLTLGYYCVCPIGRSGPHCEVCADGFTFRADVCARDCGPYCEFREGEDTFSRDLCKFYCQLEFWRELATESGLMLPEVIPRNLNLSPEEQWTQAIEERNRFDAFWRLEATGNGVDLTNADIPPDVVDSSIYDRWKQLLETSLHEQASWQNHIEQTQPEIYLLPFTTIDEICQAVEVNGVSPVYGNLLTGWSVQSAQCI